MSKRRYFKVLEQKLRARLARAKTPEATAEQVKAIVPSRKRAGVPV